MEGYYQVLVPNAIDSQGLDQPAKEYNQNELDQYLKLSFKDLFEYLKIGNPKEMKIFFLYRLSELLSQQEVEITYVEHLSNFILKESHEIPKEIFLHINKFIFDDISRMIIKCQRVSELKPFINISKLMIKSGAEKELYINLVKMKLIPLIWRSINNIQEERFDKNEIFETLSVIKYAQDYSIPVDTTVNNYIPVIIDYINTKCCANADSEGQSQEEDVKYLVSCAKLIIINNNYLRTQIKTLIDKYCYHERASLNIIKEKLTFKQEIYHQSCQEFSVKVELYESNDSSKIAIKTYEKRNNELNLKKIYKEIKFNEILSEKANENNCFLKFYESNHIDDKIQLFMEYHEMNLHDKIKQKKEQSSKFTNEELYKHIRKLLLSFKIMEESKIYHRDIKPKNMLYTNTNEIKIIDFSASDMKITDQRSSEMTKNNTVTGTETFMAPEIQEAYIKGEKKFRGWREQADVFSLGMTIFQMIYLGNLNTYNLRENNQKLMDLVDQEVKDNAIKELLKGMLNKDYRERLDFLTCLNSFPNIETVD